MPPKTTPVTRDEYEKLEKVVSALGDKVERFTETEVTTNLDIGELKHGLKQLGDKADAHDQRFETTDRRLTIVERAVEQNSRTHFEKNVVLFGLPGKPCGCKSPSHPAPSGTRESEADGELFDKVISYLDRYYSEINVNFSDAIDTVHRSGVNGNVEGAPVFVSFLAKKIAKGITGLCATRQRNKL